MKKKLYPLFAVLLGTMLVGCADDFDRNYEFDEYTPAVILKAKQYIESGQADFSLLNMNKAYANDPDYAAVKNTADYSIKWGDYRIKTENNEDVVFVPIKINKKKNQAFSLLTEEGRFKGGSHQIYTTLIIREGNFGDKGFDAAVGTYMYGHNMKDADVMKMGLDFESAGYNGYFILSALDGTMLTGRLFEEGKTKALFVQNPLSPKERKAQEKAQEIEEETQGDTIKHKKHEHLHIFLNYVPNRVFKKTKSGGDDIEWIITHCPYCGALWDNCNCYTVTACSHCGYNLNSSGQCPYACSWCGECLYGTSGHDHNPPSGPALDDGGNTGGGGGPGPGPGPGPEPEPDPIPEPNLSIYPFTNLPMQERIDSIRHSAPRAVQAVRAKDAQLGRGNIPISQQPMMCNYSVGKFYEALFGEVPDYLKHSISDYGYEYALANEWYDRVPNHPEEWGLIQGNLSDQVHIQAWLLEAQTMANEGYFVIGVADGFIVNGKREPGHIVVVIPSPDGQLVAGNWRYDTPHTIDCGSRRRSDNTDLSVGFKDPDKWLSKIKFYYHK